MPSKIWVFVTYLMVLLFGSCKVYTVTTQSGDISTVVHYRSNDTIQVSKFDSIGRIYESKYFKCGRLENQFIYNYDKETGYCTKLTVDNNRGINGPYISYFPSGAIYQAGSLAHVTGFKIEYLDGNHDISIISTTNDSALIDVGNFIEYYENGKIKLKGKYSWFYYEISDKPDNITLGEPVYIKTERIPVKSGKFKYYDQNGRLLKVETWHEGDMIETRTAK